MHVWGLTGGIASGKSTAAQFFASHGAAIINADTLYHALLAPQPQGPSALALRVAATFPDLALLRPDHSLNRQRLGEHVFADAAARRLLEEVTHPAVAEAAATAMQACHDAGTAHLIYDVPLLFEKQMQAAYEGVVLVWVDRQTQLTRLMQRDQISDAAAQTRLTAQMDLDSKRPLARWVVDNSGALAATHVQLAQVWKAMQQE